MVVWTSAWLHGEVASDDVLDALQAWADAHEVCASAEDLAVRWEIPGPNDPPGNPALLLAALRRLGGGEAELILPVPGDVRGLDGATDFAKLALRCGEAGLFRQPGLGLVPRRVAEGVLRWTVFDTGELQPAEPISIGEAEHGMASAMREAASTLTDLDIAKHRPGVRDEIAETVASRPKPPWPDTAPPRALRVLQRASEVEAILWVATDDAPGGALSASASRARTQALRPLFDAVRAARRASIAEMIRVFTERASKP